MLEREWRISGANQKKTVHSNRAPLTPPGTWVCGSGGIRRGRAVNLLPAEGAERAGRLAAGRVATIRVGTVGARAFAARMRPRVLRMLGADPAVEAPAGGHTVILGDVRRRHWAALLTAVVLGAAAVRAQDQPIDAARSVVRVLISTTGVVAHTYVIEAPLMDGTLGEPSDPHLQIAFEARRLRVVDHPALSARDREELRERLLGPDVLDAEKHRWISYHSLTLERTEGGWIVGGELNLHGQVRPLTVKVAREKNRYTGSATFRPADFGIAPVAALGGTVRVKDDVEVQFDIVPE